MSSNAKLSLEQIRDFWTQQAHDHGASHAASWSDRGVIELEIATLLKYLEDGQRVLDVGCANGYSTLQFASQRAARFRGVDYIPEMIEIAKRRAKELAGRVKGSLEFAVGNIMKLDEPSDAYDRVVVVRVLINLGNWLNQRIGLQECARVVRSGGMLLVSEATVQGWSRLNEFRREWGLDDLPMPAFNNYLDELKVIEAAHEAGLVPEGIVDFAGTYYVGTRVIKPLLAKTLGGNINIADPEMHWNRWFAQLPQAGDYATQKLFVFRKR